MELLDLIGEIFEAYHKRYGSPRVWKELMDTHGQRVSRKRVERLMRENRLQARRRQKFVATMDSSHGFAVANKLLNREFTVTGPGEQ